MKIRKKLKELKGTLKGLRYSLTRTLNKPKSVEVLCEVHERASRFAEKIIELIIKISCRSTAKKFLAILRSVQGVVAKCIQSLREELAVGEEVACFEGNYPFIPQDT